VNESALPTVRARGLPDSLTFGRTARRSFEVRYWKDIAYLAGGEYLNKANSDCVRDTVTDVRLKHHHRDL